MDILISSNLERMLFELSGCDNNAVAAMQKELATTGKFTVSDSVKAKLSELFYGGCCDDTATLATIRDTFQKFGYLCDTHTAVAVNVYNQYKAETGDRKHALIASTASPYKFAESVLSAVSPKKATEEFENVRILSEVTGTAVPAPIAALENAQIRFNNLCDKSEMRTAVLKSLGIEE